MYYTYHYDVPCLLTHYSSPCCYVPLSYVQCLKGQAGGKCIGKNCTLILLLLQYHHCFKKSLLKWPSLQNHSKIPSFYLSQSTWQCFLQLLRCRVYNEDKVSIVTGFSTDDCFNFVLFDFKNPLNDFQVISQN